MKVLSKLDSFILIYFCQLTIFPHKKCRIQNQILHFISDKHKFNKLFHSLLSTASSRSLLKHVREQFFKSKYFILFS